MKKFFIPALFFTAVFMIAQEPLVIDYYAYLYPGIYTKGNQYTQYRVINEVLETVYKNTGIKLNLHFEKGYKQRPETNRKMIELEKKLTGMSEPYEVVAHSSLEYFKDFINLGYFLSVDELLKEYAPSIYSSYPEQYWEYRARTGDTYGIPVKQYDFIDHYGFWVIKNEFLKELNLTPDQAKSKLLIILAACSKTEKPDYFSLAEVEASNVLITNIDQKWFPEEIISHLVELDGYSLVDKEEFLFDNISMELTPIKNEPQLVEKIKEIYEKTTHAWNFDGKILNVLHYTDWVCAFIPLGCPYIGASQWDLKYIDTWFSSEEYTIISELEYIKHTPFDEYEYLYIPANSQDPIRTIQALDLFHKDKFWFDLFTFGPNKASNGLPGNTYTLPTGPYYYNMGDFRSPLSLLGNNKYRRIPSFLPEKVKKDFTKYLEEAELMRYNHPLYGLDIKKVMEKALLRMGSKYTDILPYYLHSPHRDHWGIEILLKSKEEANSLGVNRILTDKLELEKYKILMQNELEAYIQLADRSEE